MAELGQAADLEQFESERLDLGQHAVQRGLVRDGAAQQRVLAVDIGAQGGEGAPHGRAQVAADPDLVVHRLVSGSDARARAMLARAKTHRTASRMDRASTDRKSPMNCAATPTPTTGMTRPQ